MGKQDWKSRIMKLGRYRLTRRRVYRFVTGTRFPVYRLIFWGIQVPPAVLWTAMAESVRYLVFLSIAALIESALTDYVEAWKFEEGDQ